MIKDTILIRKPEEVVMWSLSKPRDVQTVSEKFRHPEKNLRELKIECVFVCVLVALPVKNINQPVLNCYCSARTTKYKNTALHKLTFS